MIGFVVVSHSKKLANEVINLCNKMKAYDFSIVNGSGKEGKELGSDPLVIKKAIESAYSKNGVLIFTDIGSSISNTEKAINLLNDNYDKEKIKIADAPLVEGPIIAMAINDGKTALDNIILELKELKKFNKTS